MTADRKVNPSPSRLSALPKTPSGYAPPHRRFRVPGWVGDLAEWCCREMDGGRPRVDAIERALIEALRRYEETRGAA